MNEIEARVNRARDKAIEDARKAGTKSLMELRVEGLEAMVLQLCVEISDSKAKAESDASWNRNLIQNP